MLRHIKKVLYIGVDFNDEENPTITYENAFGNNVTQLDVCISLTGAADIPYRTISSPGTSGSYTFNLTTAERNTLRNSCVNAKTRNVTFYIRTQYNGGTWTDTSVRTLTIVNANPTFSNYTFQDEGVASSSCEIDSVKLTAGSSATSSNIFIDDYNRLKVHIASAQKAVGVKGASIVKYQLVCGDKSVENTSVSSNEIILGLDCIRSRTIEVTAIDSRGNSTKVTKTISTNNWKAYEKLNLSSWSVKRNNDIDTKTKLTFAGTFWNNSFGSVTNSIKTCKYRYRKSGSTGSWTEKSITPTVSGGNISFDSFIIGDAGDTINEGFILSNAYDIQLYIEDQVGNKYAITKDMFINKGSPGFAIAPEGVSFGSPYNSANGGVLQIMGRNIDNAIVDKKYYTGNCNDVNETCVLWVNNGSGVPSGLSSNYGFLVTKVITSSYIEQEFADGNTNLRWTRSKVNGTWKSWEPLVTIVEKGSNTNGKYIKYSDGTMICYMKKTYNNIAMTQAWGTIYECDALNLGNFPVAFVEAPSVTASVSGGNGSCWLERLLVSASSLGSSWFCRPTQMTCDVQVDYIAIGRWK